VVPNGVDTHWFHPTPQAAARAAPSVAAMGLAATAPLVVAVGRLCRQKGQDVLLEAWPAVVERIGGARLALVGDGPDAAALARAVRDDPRLRGVYLAGAAADPRPWYQAADLVVLPSRWEGMALTVLEASSCARRIVASDVAGVRESLPEERPAWSVVTPGDPRALGDALAEALDGLARDPAAWDEAGERAARHARARHDISRVTGAVFDLYAEVLWQRTVSTAP
jgi:glycosyltransferase involved in cell wall biosynthesis